MSTHKTYNQEYKIGAIKMVEQKGKIMLAVSKALGINEGMLFRWRKEYNVGKFESFPGNGWMLDKNAYVAKLPKKTNGRWQIDLDYVNKKLNT